MNALTPSLFLTCSKTSMSLYEHSRQNTWTKKAAIKCKSLVVASLCFKREKDMLIVAWKDYNITVYECEELGELATIQIKDGLCLSRDDMFLCVGGKNG